MKRRGYISGSRRVSELRSPSEPRGRPVPRRPLGRWPYLLVAVLFLLFALVATVPRWVPWLTGR